MHTDDATRRTWSINNPADLGRAIAGVRAERGLTQEELGRTAGIDRAYLARLEAGASPLVLERSIRALRRMGATVTVSVGQDGGER
jgi:transcriptional regulator with XRE-family HTH domain